MVSRPSIRIRVSYILEIHIVLFINNFTIDGLTDTPDNYSSNTFAPELALGLLAPKSFAH